MEISLTDTAMACVHELANRDKVFSIFSFLDQKGNPIPVTITNWQEGHSMKALETNEGRLLMHFKLWCLIRTLRKHNDIEKKLRAPLDRFAQVLQT